MQSTSTQEPVPTHQLPTADQAAIERLLTDFAWHADRGDGSALGELFSPDGTLHVGGLDLNGQQAIADDCLRRAARPGRRTRHVWSNLRIERALPAHIVATAVQVTYEQPGEGQAMQVRVNDMADTFVKDSDGRWRFASRRVERALAFAT
ncbi:nuclear transport factor 2 family protein [Variovorax sp. ZS18.2.2]|uniref:nuclear transport factor 2 family protein n=1 Tax=Variovorax sp. ZS18.2.2 TaxID=2971255 RepID=UPI002151959B|nr:nuclear transport factor 2 family protein [Variovorax sp. ZS18.2.2]MCR6480495.1 nuclear transport factor 2 family protein [Variovorax sp. ZS18.2.2]